jgi:hypothetical protein
MRLPGAQVVSTRALLTARENTRAAIDAKAMICIYGQAGNGKSFAVNACLRQLAPKLTRREPAQAASDVDAAPGDAGSVDYDVINGRDTEDPEPAPPLAPDPEAQQPAAVPTVSEAIPEPWDATPPGGSADRPPAKRSPYHDGIAAAQHLIHKMPADEFSKMLELLNAHWQRQPATTE